MSTRIARGASVVFVSVYMVVVALWLMITGRIEARPLRLYVKSKFRRRFSAPILEIVPETGHCWTVRLNRRLQSDDRGFSRLRLFEDDRQLGPAHCAHDEIRSAGGGRYSHWGDHLYFSSSDNSDPRSNGRRYSVREL